MTDERRQHPRFNRPLDGVWHGPSGNGPCRIVDISVGGCFIESLAMPPVGETAVITVEIGEHSMSFKGEVLYVESNMGFAVKFRAIPTDHFDGLMRFIRSLEVPTT